MLQSIPPQNGVRPHTTPSWDVAAGAYCRHTWVRCHRGDTDVERSLADQCCPLLGSAGCTWRAGGDWRHTTVRGSWRGSSSSTCWPRPRTICKGDDMVVTDMHKYSQYRWHVMYGRYGWLCDWLILGKVSNCLLYYSNVIISLDCL